MSIVEAALRCRADEVELQLVGGCDVNFRDFGAQTALMIAARHGHEEMARLLIGHNADVNAEDLVHSTALHEAVGAGSMTCVALLLDAKAEPRKRTLANETAIWKAQSSGFTELAQLLEEDICRGRWRVDDPNALSSLCAAGDVTTVKDALLCGHSASGLESGTSPLYVAAGAGNTDVAEALLDALADPDRAGSAGTERPLIRAAQKSHDELVELLISRGASLEAPGKHSMTALAHACYGECTEVVRTLVQAAADVCAVDDYGAIPLHWAAYSGDAASARLLLSCSCTGTCKVSARCCPSRQQLHRNTCLLYTSPSPRDRTRSRMPSSA
eukprot:TRINITY_DN3111_c0_g1_i5.p1 TRINITY_DN3111_c0_g1~~TRINITY_DN3111_c0_g1_i5.p1  ORF type:complete len:329 (-),score=68.89 TRINITY_DN3111_c0_g1_i5:19-1005(-)